ncbi:MAG: hypothetical protein JSV88_20100 [Candidatus Aminicenantes bacterium]|nr:MAG: hypothetical protein JSV88_20100 [Candidatus Aminicenantes bacterium]
MRKNVLFYYLLIFFGFVLCITPLKGNISAEEKPGQYLEIELKRIEETYRLLDRFAEEIWPRWDNYNDIEVRVRFPNMVHLLVNPRQSVPEGYERLQGRTLQGKSIFINRKKELPIKIAPPLKGGGGGGLTIRIRLRQVNVPPEELKKLKKPPPGYQPMVDSDGQILLYVHEFFHGFQRKYELSGKGDDALYKFKVNTEYATYSNIEGLALLNAYNEKDHAGALEFLKDYLVAREIKQTFMPPGSAAAEQFTAVSEGTASYSNIKMAMILRDNKYKPGISQQDDPFFFNFKFMDGYIENNLTKDLRFTMEFTLEKVGKCYAFGAYLCLVLDRFVPGWKNGFFQEKKNLDQVTANFLKLSPAQKKVIADRLKTKYPYDELYAKHNAVIKERDEAITMIKNRTGKKYIVDFKKTREFPLVKPRGKVIRIDVEQIFLHGIEKLDLGEIELTSIDTPMHRPWLYTFEWIDTEADKDKKGYEISFKEKIEDTYKKVVFKTNGFTLKAPELQINEDKTKNEVHLVILSKVAR